MSTIVIKSDAKSNELIRELAEKLGGDIIDLNDKHFEDLALGSLMDKTKTDKRVSRQQVFEALKNK